MAACGPQGDYFWKDCDDFQLPNNSVWFGTDDDGSDIFCGKAWSDGREVPAKIIPARKECRVKCDNGDRVVTNCRKVLICSRDGDDCRRRRHHRHHHHHRHRDHCHPRDDCCSSSSDSEEEDSSYTRTSASSRNNCRVYVKGMRSSSNSTTVTVKKHKKKREGRRKRVVCRDVQRTRMVPKVTEVPRVRYVPKVTMERSVRYVPETYTTRVCEERCCESRRDRCCESRRDDCSVKRCDSYDDCCESSSVDCCEPCDDSFRHFGRRCREAVVCEVKSSEPCLGKEEVCIRPERCEPQPRANKGLCC